MRSRGGAKGLRRDPTSRLGARAKPLRIRRTRMSIALTPAEVAARLDRLPPSRFHRRFLALISLGAWFDMYDNFLAGPLAVALPAAGVFPRESEGWVTPLGLFMAALPLGMFLGSVFFGMASDYVGRRF